MKKLLCLALALLMCVSLFVGCGKFDMESADLESYVKLGKIDSFSYDELKKHYMAYREELGANTTNFYFGTGDELDFDVKAEVKNADGTFTAIPEWTLSVKDYAAYRNPENSLFDKAFAYELEDASATAKTPRLIWIGEAFSFTMPIDEDASANAGKTVKFTVTVTSVLPALYTDNELTEELSEFYNNYASTKEVIEMGDSVQIDYVGKIDGETFTGGSASDQVFTVGEGGFIDNFEEQLVGHKNGSAFDITVTFPADYREESLRGKEAVFTITVDVVSNDNAIISDNTPFADIWELKEHYRVMRYIEYAIVDYIADNSTMISLPEKLVESFRKSYEDYVAREVTEAVLYYAEKGETITKAAMKEKLYPNGSDKEYVEKMAKDAAYNYILVHLLLKETGLTYSERQYERDAQNIAEQYTEYYGETYTVKDVEKMVGEEILRLSFLDALVSPKFASRVTGIPEFRNIDVE